MLTSILLTNIAAVPSSCSVDRQWLAADLMLFAKRSQGSDGLGPRLTGSRQRKTVGPGKWKHTMQHWGKFRETVPSQFLVLTIRPTPPHASLQFACEQQDRYFAME